MIPATRVTDATTLTVELGERSYPIVIGQGLLKGGFDLTPYLSGSDCLIVSNETVAPLYMDSVSALLRDRDAHALQLPDGESFKTMATMQSVIDKLAGIGANRDVTVATSPDLQPPAICAALPVSRFRQLCWHRWIRQSAARPALTTNMAKT